MRIPFIDLQTQYATIRSDVIKAVLDVLEDTSLPLELNVRAFEAEFAAFCGTPHAVGVGSGTDALVLALRACGVRAGDEVITAANGSLSTTEAIVRTGANPVYVDVEPETYNLDPNTVRAAITRDTRAIVPVHLYGLVADMDPIMDLAGHYGLVVVEDARHAPGAEYGGRRAGSLGHAAAFSFSMAKNLSAYGEAGAVTTTSQAVADEVRRLKNHGLAPAAERSATKVRLGREDLGLDCPLDELHAVVLRVKLRHLDAWNARRRDHALAYRQLLEDLPITMPNVPTGTRHVYYRFAIRIADRERVRRALAARGVETSAHYPFPDFLQVDSTVGRGIGPVTVAEAVAREVVFLPMYPELKPNQIAYVGECLRATLAVEHPRATELALPR